MAGDFEKKDLDYGFGYGPGYGPGYGMGFADRLRTLVSETVTVYFEDGAPIRGTLQAVGNDYIELRRMRDNVLEVVLIPLRAVIAVTGPRRERSAEAYRP